MKLRKALHFKRFSGFAADCHRKLEMSPRAVNLAGRGIGKAAVDGLLGLRVAAGDARQALTVAVCASRPSAATFPVIPDSIRDPLHLDKCMGRRDMDYGSSPQ